MKLCHFLYHYFAAFQKSKRKNKLIKHIFTVKFVFSVFCCSLQILFSLCSFYLSQGKILFSWDGSASSCETEQLFTSVLLPSRNTMHKDAANWKENLSKDVFLSVLFFKGLESKIDKWLFL